MPRVAFAVAWCFLICGGVSAAELPRSTPEAQGVSSAAVRAFVDAAGKVDQMHSFILVRHGQVVAEGWWAPFAAQDPHMLYSLSKSFTSTAVGTAIAEGKLSLDDTVLSFFPDDAPAEPSENLKAMRVRDLLSMNTGHHIEEIQAFDFNAPGVLTERFLAMPVAHKPGTHFVYNTPATYMCSAIVQKATGKKVLDYLGPKLFEPLGIDSPTWSESAQGINHGGFGLNVRTEDIAKFGQFYLARGQWNGKQLLPAEWIDLATSRQTSNGSNPTSDWEQGYGYQFWRCRHGFYRGDGAFGQYCVVMPEEDAVLAITSGVRDMQAVLNAAWDNLLPGFKDQQLPADAVGAEKLHARLAALRVPTPEGSASSPLAERVSGVTYDFPANPQDIESVSLTTAGNETAVAVRVDGDDYELPCPFGAWHKGATAMRKGVDPRSPERGAKAATAGAWTADNVYTAKIVLYETPYYQTITLKFDGDAVTLHTKYNVAFAPSPTDLPALVGKKRP